MLADFFQLAPLPIDRYPGIYDLRLVLLSFMVAIFASYIALDLVGRLRDVNNTNTSKLLWLVGGAIAMGSGIWSMHFIGMLSFKIPGLTLQYDAFWTLLSLLVAILASGFALALLKTSVVNVVHLIAGGIILGLAIASMHYTGMEGMLITLNIRYLPSLFFLSVLVAIIASEAAIWMALKSTKVVIKHRTRIKVISAVIMGLAICGMHYTGMAASIFTPLCTAPPCPSNIGNSAVDPTILAMYIAAVTIIILSIAFFASTYQESLNQQFFEKARQLGVAEISANILHNVGNVLNSVSVSTHSLFEKNNLSKLKGLENLSTLLNEHKSDLPEFIKNDPRGQKVLDYITNLAAYQREEQLATTKEINSLINNIGLIKDIISTQQELSKTDTIEDIVDINELLDETILITGLNLKKEIQINKQYDKISPVYIDKVKIVQVLVNLIRNAKEAVLESKKPDKEITLKSLVDKNKIYIEVLDNGIGILPKNINKIFNYGFTTKPKGHGFGLHATALSINELGGEIRVKSEGYEKGTMFTIELPYKKPK